MMRISVTPFRSPFALNSRAAGDEDCDKVLQAAHDILASASLQTTEVSWGKGYGTTRLDDLPFYFRPLFEASPTHLADYATVTWARAFFYDDRVAVLYLGFDEAVPLSDEEINEITYRFLDDLYETALKEAETRINKRKTTIFEPRASKHPGPSGRDRVFWVARAEVRGQTTDLRAEDLDWIATDRSAIRDLVGAGCAIGMGNTLFWQEGSDTDLLMDDFIRATSLCQFYTCVLGQFQDRFRDAFRKLEHSKRVTKSDSRALEGDLDHLTFIRLQYQRALYGLQGRRKQIAGALSDAWRLEAQQDNTLGWAEALKSQLDRDFRRQQKLQDVAIRLILGFIGAISILDVSIALKDASASYSDDGVWGILDVFHSLAADSALYTAMFVVLIAMIISFRSEK